MEEKWGKGGGFCCQGRLNGVLNMGFGGWDCNGCDTGGFGCLGLGFGFT